MRAPSHAEAYVRLVVDQVRDIVVVSDVHRRIRFASPSCRELGYTPEEMVGFQVTDFAHPDDAARMAANIAKLAAGEPTEARDRRYRLRRKDGSYGWYESSPTVLFDDAGNLTGFLSCARDIGEEQAAEQALAASEARYRLIADNMNDLLACSGRDGLLSFVAGAWMQILGYEPQEVLGLEAPSFVHPDDLERVRAEFRRAIKAGPGGGAFRVEYRARRKDGTYTWLEAHPRAHFDAAGAFVEFQDIVRDISGHKALEDRLEATAKARAEFLADLAHELRGPLNSVQGLARLARKRPGLQEPARGYMARIEEATTAILVQVEDVLEFSRLDAAKVVFRPQPIELDPFARAAVAQFEAQARAKGLALDYASAAPAGLTLEFDADRLRQVVLNLLDNAVKFTRSGAVRLETAYDAAAGRLSVAVSDTGLGIPADQIEPLFWRFVQASGAQAYRGAGLGLSISKRLVEGMGGQIGATSEIGAGSRFAFWIPARAAGPPRADAPGAEAQPRIRILVADAHPGVAARVVEALGAQRAEVTTAADGMAALDIAAREPFDLMLVDLGLAAPGAQVLLRRLRRRRGLNMTTPVVALGSEADDPSADGFAGLVAKPLSRTELLSAIIQTLHASRTGRPG